MQRIAPAVMESIEKEKNPIYMLDFFFNRWRLSKYLVRRKLLIIDPLYLLAGSLNVLMRSRAGQFTERGKGLS